MAGRVLLFDSEATQREALRRQLSASCYEVELSESVAEFRSRARTGRPDLALCDLDADAPAALAACRALCGRLEATQTAVVLYGTSIVPEAARAARRAGAWAVLSKPLDDVLLPATLRRVLRQRRALVDWRRQASSAADLGLMEDSAAYRHVGRVALVAPSSDGGEHDLAARLRAEGVRFDLLTPEDALSAGTRLPPDLYVLPCCLSGNRDGLRLLSELRSRTSRAEAQVMIVLDDSPRFDCASHQDAAMALDLGADDVVLPQAADDIALRVDRLLGIKRLADRSMHGLRSGIELAARDPLTGLYNRRFALPRLHRLYDRAAEAAEPLALMVLDLDRFKEINDRYGHAAGDDVLMEIARRLGGAVRPRDLVARSGGEEFWIALPNTGRAAAKQVGEALCTLIRNDPITLPGLTRPVRVTASIGIAVADSSDGGEGGLQRLLGAADRALYAAKHSGRDMASIDGCAA